MWERIGRPIRNTARVGIFEEGAIEFVAQALGGGVQLSVADRAKEHNFSVKMHKDANFNSEGKL